MRRTPYSQKNKDIKDRPYLNTMMRNYKDFQQQSNNNVKNSKDVSKVPASNNIKVDLNVLNNPALSSNFNLNLNGVQGEAINLPKYKYQGHLTYRSKISPFVGNNGGNIGNIGNANNNQIPNGTGNSQKRPITTNNRSFSFHGNNPNHTNTNGLYHQNSNKKGGHLSYHQRNHSFSNTNHNHSFKKQDNISYLHNHYHNNSNNQYIGSKYNHYNEKAAKLAVSLDQKKRELFVSNNRQSPILKNQNQSQEENNINNHINVNINGNHYNSNNKGKIYRGSSWKPQQKIKGYLTGRQTPTSNRYSPSLQNNNNSNVNNDEKNLHNNYKTSGDKRSSNHSQPQSYHGRSSSSSSALTKKLTAAHQAYSNHSNGYIMDLIGRNLNKPLQQHQKNQFDNNFFQYVMRFSYRTRKGFIPSNSGKVNQDAYIMTPNINAKTWQHFFAVCDGHGPLGHHVSGFIKNHLSACISAQKNLEKNPKEALQKAFAMAYNKLIKQSKIDMSFSGSTIIGCYLFQNKLFSCNVGDSRAIVGKNYGHRKWKAQSLSIDHKPSLQSQAQRIRSMNGRVQSYKDQFGQTIGPLRVWIKGDNIPGLAMTRSFGDLVGASVGVSPIPQIKQFTLTQEDKILIIASDGVFQFLQNQQIIQSLIPYYQKKDIQQASDYLLNKAHRSWLDNSSIIDDITFIMIFLNYNEIQ